VRLPRLSASVSTKGKWNSSRRCISRLHPPTRRAAMPQQFHYRPPAEHLSLAEQIEDFARRVGVNRQA
jgi:hypothetical protein